jgi:hypothetical protein
LPQRDSNSHVSGDRKLREASQQQQFNRSIEDVEGWLYEIEGQLKSEDYGKVKKKGR